jgi:hypothetical protein
MAVVARLLTAVPNATDANIFLDSPPVKFVTAPDTPLSVRVALSTADISRDRFSWAISDTLILSFSSWPEFSHIQPGAPD